MILLADNFSLDEFEASSLATRLGITNRVPNELMENARATAAMLQRIRNKLGELLGRDIPIHVTSGYRCLMLNRELRSADTSDHLEALAADWRAPAAGTPTRICTLLAPFVDELHIGQLINEYPDGNGWVHTSVRLPRKRMNRVITITRAGTDVGIHDGAYA